MKFYRWLFLPVWLGIVLAISASEPGAVFAQPAAENASTDFGQALCLPDVYAVQPADCLLQGPAQALSAYGELGITFPPLPLPLATPTYDLNRISFQYAKVNDGVVPVYGSLEDAIAGRQVRIMPAGANRYVSYTYREKTPKATFYRLNNGEWINRDNITPVGVPVFQGFEIKGDLRVSFGWILYETASQRTPGYKNPAIVKQYWRNDLVRVYETQTIDGVDWLMIGPDEWIEDRLVNRVAVENPVPEGVDTNRWVEVNLNEQVLSIHEQGKLVFATPISSGRDPFFTKPGLFKIYQKLEVDKMTGSFESDRSDYYYFEDVPYIMYYDQKRALHAAYWNTFLGHPSSHGCINLSVGDSHWVFDWANEGDYVYVWDPSGKTPTDPSKYGAGGF